MEIYSNHIQKKPHSLLVITKRPEVFSIIYSQYADKYDIVQAHTIAELADLIYVEIARCLIIYVDISDRADDGSETLTEVNTIIPHNQIPILTIVDKKHTKQYNASIIAGAKAIITMPMDTDALLRRTRRFLRSNMR